MNVDVPFHRRLHCKFKLFLARVWVQVYAILAQHSMQPVLIQLLPWVHDSVSQVATIETWCGVFCCRQSFSHVNHVRMDQMAWKGLKNKREAQHPPSLSLCRANVPSICQQNGWNDSLMDIQYVHHDTIVTWLNRIEIGYGVAHDGMAHSQRCNKNCISIFKKSINFRHSSLCVRRILGQICAPLLQCFICISWAFCCWINTIHKMIKQKCKQTSGTLCFRDYLPLQFAYFIILFLLFLVGDERWCFRRTDWNTNKNVKMLSQTAYVHFSFAKYGASIRCVLFLMEYEMDLMSARCQRTLWITKDSAKRTGNPFIEAGADGQLNEPYNAMHWTCMSHACAIAMAAARLNSNVYGPYTTIERSRNWHFRFGIEMNR